MREMPLVYAWLLGAMNSYVYFINHDNTTLDNRDFFTIICCLIGNRLFIYNYVHPNNYKNVYLNINTLTFGLVFLGRSIRLWQKYY